MDNETPDLDQPAGLDRRSLLKRGAVVGGALVWTTPIVQTIAQPAFADESDQDTAGCPPGTTQQFGFKVDGGGLEAGFNGRNQCIPDGADGTEGDRDLPEGTDASFTDNTGTFTIPEGFDFISLCVVGGQNRGDDPLEFELTGPTLVDGNQVFTFTTSSDDPAISNFSVLFEGPCPVA